MRADVVNECYERNAFSNKCNYGYERKFKRISRAFVYLEQEPVIDRTVRTWI